MKYPPSIQKLIDLFIRFPTVGPKTAARFVFYLLKKGEEENNQLLEAISNLQKRIKICSRCFKSFESPEGKKELCEICSDPRRDVNLLCVIEKETDLLAIENTKKYRGRYFILGGVISTLKKKDFQDIRNEELKELLKKESKIKEVIIAINPTREGEATSLYVERLLKPFNKKITRLGRGLPVGGELEYADKETLSSALEGRK